MRRDALVRGVFGRVIKDAQNDGTRPEVLQALCDLVRRTKVAHQAT